MSRLVVLALAGVVGCGGGGGAIRVPDAPAGTAFAPEAVPRFVTLAGPSADPLAELSGLAWDGDTLLMLPQFPDRLDASCLFGIERDNLASALAADRAITPRCVSLDLDGVDRAIEGYEGFEAVVVHGDRVTLAIEVRETPLRMRGTFVDGTITRDATGLVTSIQLDASTALDVPAPAAIANKAFEAMVVFDDGLLALFELATPRFVDPPVAAWIDPLDAAEARVRTVSVDPLVGRWTDATATDEAGRFFVVNYVWPGDAAIVEDAADDDLARAWGRGATHDGGDTLERIVEMQFDGTSVTRLDRAPTWLELDHDAGPRNWEGIARWSEGAVVLVTDRFPGTRLAIVPLVVGPGRHGVVAPPATEGLVSPRAAEGVDG